MARREAGFADLRSQPRSISRELSEKDRLIQLERKILLLEAQIDFLKKI